MAAQVADVPATTQHGSKFLGLVGVFGGDEEVWHGVVLFQNLGVFSAFRKPRSWVSSKIQRELAK
jgi:hypothetical protein